jgi:transglutaminase-like putative cysteine protease
MRCAPPSTAACFLALAIALAVPGALSAGRAVVGDDQAEFLLPRGLMVADYANNGFRMAVDGQRARIEVQVRPLASAAAFVPPRASAAGEPEPVEALARAVTAGADSHYDAVSRILAWVSRNVHYSLDRREAQDPLSVLDRRTAYCTGSARLTVALLAAVGIDAREVAGLVIQKGGTVRFHRWVEIDYRDRGWAFSDPLRSHHYVPASYLPLASEELRVPRPQGMKVERLSQRQSLWVIDTFPGVAEGVRGRKNDDRQTVGVLRVEAPGDSAAMVVLEGDGLRRRIPLDAGAGTFLDVEPGSYVVRLEGEGIEPQTLRVRLRDRRRSIVHMPPRRGR